MELSEDQKRVIEQAIELIKPFDKESCSFSLHYFKLKDCDGEEIGEEVCDNQKCVNKYLKDLRAQIGKGKRIFTVYDHYNNGDHEKIASCANCGRPLNEQLTWIKYEFEHHQEHSITKEAITDSRTAFDIRCMLEAMPSSDYSISGYAKHQSNMFNSIPLDTELKWQSDFVNEVVAYAELIIKVLNT